MFGEWITEEILYPLPHRQYVFTVPKMLRPRRGVATTWLYATGLYVQSASAKGCGEQF
ncbi:MAG: hypothetical protein HY694_06875 [Deltaproteobacteria bacterium]|nr:hypothetical protein [Deltaproteobacteria bacterium]